MDSTATEMSDELFMHIPLEQLTASRFQPAGRKPDSDLVESVRQHGVVTPGLARPTPDGPTAYEVVFGHCRWAAAAAAELPSMPFVVRELDDVTALELMLVENLRRSDLHPMDEAEGYHQLHEQHGQSVEQIADRVGKSKAYVYARLKLLALRTEGREAFRAGDLDASVALYLARVPGSLQSSALKALRNRAQDGDRISARTAAWLLQQQFMLQLEKAPFQPGDAGLVAEAGACTDCLKRTGNQRELFADVESADVCTDPVCYRKKVDAVWQIRTKDKATPTLSAKETKALWPHGPHMAYQREWIDLADSCYDAGGKPYKKALAKAMPEVTLARDPDGGVHELVKRVDAEKALKELGLLKKVSPASSGSSSSKPKSKDSVAKEKAKLELAEKVSAAAIVAVVDAAENAKKRTVLVAVVQELAQGSGYVAAARRGIKDDATLKKNIPGMTEEGLHGLLVEMALFPDGAHLTWDGRIEKSITDACKAFGVDLKAIEKKVKAELDAAAKMPADLKSKPVKKGGKKS
jgi:ParB/RepB/Spo0J family partition protein